MIKIVPFKQPDCVKKDTVWELQSVIAKSGEITVIFSLDEIDKIEQINER